MPRGIAWDDLPNHLTNKKFDNTGANSIIKEKKDEKEAQERNVLTDVTAIGKRGLFGVIAGGLTGAAFGFVNVLKDPKLLASKAKTGRVKVLDFAGKFAGFFGLYHACRKTIKLYTPISNETNVMASAALTITPIAIIPSLRPLLPYSLLMVILDAINGIDDI